MEDDEIYPLASPTETDNRGDLRLRQPSRRSSQATFSTVHDGRGSISSSVSAPRTDNQNTSAAEASSRHSRSGSTISFAPSEVGKHDIPLKAWNLPGTDLSTLTEVETPNRERDEMESYTPVSLVSQMKPTILTKYVEENQTH